MPDSAAVVFALAMAVWVADVRFAPKPATPVTPSESSASGPTSSAPDNADAEVVVYAPRAR
jgi:hypothetical protein